MTQHNSRGWLVGQGTKLKPGHVATAAGMLVNLCLGILYAWSVWKAVLISGPAGDPMTGLNEGWFYLSDPQATWAYSICGLTFALCMIPGGRLQDRYGARVGATSAGIFLGLGCMIAGFMKSYFGLIVGFGLLGGIGMGLGYAAATPAAVRWFGPHRRGTVVGLVVAGYGAAAIYIAPVARELIATVGLSGSFYWLGGTFALVIVVAAQFLVPPPSGLIPAASSTTDPNVNAVKPPESEPDSILKSWHFYRLVLLFVGSAQAGLLVIANAALLGKSASSWNFFAENSWLLASYGGFINAIGRMGTGRYSDSIGRVNSFTLNGLTAAAAMLTLPWVLETRNVPLLLLSVGVIYWQYGGTLSLMPAFTADWYGAKNLGLNYGLVFIGWGIAFFIPLMASYGTKSFLKTDSSLMLSGCLLLATVILARLIPKPR